MREYVYNVADTFKAGTLVVNLDSDRCGKDTVAV